MRANKITIKKGRRGDQKKENNKSRTSKGREKFILKRPFNDSRSKLFGVGIVSAP